MTRKAIFDANVLFFGTLSLSKPVAVAEEEKKRGFSFSGNSILLPLPAHDALKTKVYLIPAAY